MSSNRPIVAGVGEVLWDCFADARRPGGAPANVAFHADQLACHGVVCSRVGDDADGQDLCAELERRSLDTSMIRRDAALPTGRVTVDTTDPSQPRYRIHENVAWDALELDDSLERLLRSAAAVCVGSLAQRTEKSRETIRCCLESAPQALRVFDVNLRPNGYRREWIDATLRRVQVVKLNLDEVVVLDDMLAVGTAEPGAFGARLIERYGLERVCVTRAERGCVLISPDGVVDVPGRPVTEVDAVGAGDAFTAALIAAQLRGWDPERTARLANEVGALVARHPGAMPDLRARFADLLAMTGD